MSSFGMQATGSTEGTFKGNLPYSATAAVAPGTATAADPAAIPPVPGSVQFPAPTLNRGEKIKFSVGGGAEQTFVVTTQKTGAELAAGINAAVTAGTLSGVECLDIPYRGTGPDLD